MEIKLTEQQQTANVMGILCMRQSVYMCGGLMFKPVYSASKPATEVNP